MNSIFALEDEDLGFLDEENAHVFSLGKEASSDKQTTRAHGKSKFASNDNNTNDKASYSFNENRFKFRVVKADNVKFPNGITSKNSSFDPVGDINWNDSDEDLDIFNKNQDMETRVSQESQHYEGKAGQPSHWPVSAATLVERNRDSQVSTGGPNSISRNVMHEPQSIITKEQQGNYYQDLSSSLVTRKRKLSKRRFPGPAGVLPQIENVAQLGKMDPKVMKGLGAEKQLPGLKKPKSNVTIMEAADPEDFKRDFWLKLQRDSIESCRGLIYHTISSIHRKATHHQLPKGKVPLMCAFIKSFTANCTDASVILRDPTGEIRGTVHQQVLERNQADLVPGAGISLKQVSVFSPSPRKHYINITPSNILYLIDPNANLDDLSQQPSQTMSKNDRSLSAGRLSIVEKRENRIITHKTSPKELEEKAVPVNSLIDDAVDDVLLDMDEDADILASAL